LFRGIASVSLDDRCLPRATASITTRFCLIQAKRMNVIDSKKLSMLFSEKWFPLFDSML